ncbi:transcriptional regulator, DeoR family [Mycoplasma leachii PG50]|uniref:Transcriptional regulator, DeoR family n=1 Tax=Mycoplasma leachii (strain DSM 21131 / NCTC 10133 / N29 / PG50) TaxID=880447 RepID=E4PSN0_MYCLG|nr:helix-turn-helix domain-containing protein [Mycoplasma leachii]ADR24170.1 transcriptional regulator, DeoR family [Mycoplasma leachii PG50]CBV67499.1 Transcriptional regulator, DeoR family, putative [Mycoplasma leachii 99/014/6]
MILELLTKQSDIYHNELMSILNTTKLAIQRDISKLKDKKIIGNLSDTRINSKNIR